MNMILNLTFVQTLFSALAEAFKDCIRVIPVLLAVFYIIEVVEYFYSDKILHFARLSKKAGPLLGAVFAAIPQCGLSIIASTMYCKRYITRGTLLSVYLATSDEAIPVLLASPKRIEIILPLILIKLAVALFSGYLVDLFFPSKKTEPVEENFKMEKGCHSHEIVKNAESAAGTGLREILIHPFVHTLSVVFFIFIVTFLVNACMAWVSAGGAGLLNFSIFKNNFVQPLLTAVFGLIPNCAVSVGITILYLKGAITFASCVSGLCAGAGLGLLVLLKNNKDKKDTAFVLALLLIISVFSGYLTLLLPM